MDEHVFPNESQRRLMIDLRMAMTRPVESDHAVATRKFSAQAREVAGAVADRVQTNERGSLAVVVVIGEPYAVDADLPEGNCGTQLESQIAHGDRNITISAREAKC